MLSAAFIGPGTVTTAAKAGALFGYQLLWALVFSTLACLVLQEASARVTLVSKKSLGEAIRESFRGTAFSIPILLIIIGGIILGSAAYQTGNLLGAVAGAELLSDFPKSWLLLPLGMAAFLILSIPRLQFIARFLGFIVVFMGLIFLSTAILLQPNWGEIIRYSLLPTFPHESALYILGLVGTTVVPYNLFLGSGIVDPKSSLAEMRGGLVISIVLGGIISMAILIVGTAIESAFSFPALGASLEKNLGGPAYVFLGAGLLIAGFSSAITAPLAAALTARSLFAQNNPQKWESRGIRFRLVWIGVLLTGLIFGLLEIKPVPAIILAQAMNGLVLPLVSIFLMIVVNDPRIMGKEQLNSGALNLLSALVLWISLIIGLLNVSKTLPQSWGRMILENNYGMFSLLLFSLMINLGLWVYIYQRRRGGD